MATPHARHRPPRRIALVAIAATAFSAAAGEATFPFVDYTLGLRIDVPAGWRYDRSLSAGPGGSVGILRGQAPDGQASLQLLVFRDVTQPLTEWIDYFTRNVGKIAGVDRIAVVGEPRDGQPAAWVVVDAHSPRARTRTIYYCCQFNPQTILVCMRAAVLGPASQPPPPAPQAPGQIPPALRAQAASLEILYDPAIDALIREARLRGARLLHSDRWLEAIGRLRVDPGMQYYLIRIANRPVGYLTRRFSREKRSLDQQARDGKDGLRVHETLWRFPPDGSVRWQRIDLFSSIDNQTDLYEIVETTLGPPGTKDPPTTRREQCVRQGDTLVRTVSVAGSPAPPDAPLKLPGDYLGLAWVRIAAALIEPQASEPVGFITYDTATRALIPQVWVPRGPATQPAAGPRYVFEIREGFNPQTARLLVDRWGRMLEYRAGPLSITAAGQAEIERTFGARRRAALQRLRELRSEPATRARP